MAAQAVVHKQRGGRQTSTPLEEHRGLVANTSESAKIHGKIKLDLRLGTLLNGVGQHTYAAI